MRRLPLAVATMVFDEPDFLGIWLRHWRRHLDDSALFVLIDGPNPELEAMAEGVNVIVCDRPPPYEMMETDRWVMLSAFMSALLEHARVAVYTDVDEIIIADPTGRGDLASRLADIRTPVANPLGIEIIHRTRLEPDPIDLARPILRQRQHFRKSIWYTKPAVITAPVRWSRGGHFSDRPGPVVPQGLFNVHLRFYDLDRFLALRARREATTRAPKEQDTGWRQWRRDEAAARRMLDDLNRARILPGRMLWTWRIRRKIRGYYKAVPDADGPFAGFVSHCAWDARIHERLPRRFLDVL